MHPLPRVNELDASLDSDRRAIYFQQAAYGVPVRMALISLLLHLHKNKSLHQFAGGFAKPDYPVYAQPIGTGLQCGNANCITGDPAERQYAANKFYVVEDERPQRCRLRCVYCEKDVEEDAATHFVVADTTRKTFSPGLAALTRDARRETQASRSSIADAADAVAAGFAPRETGASKVCIGEPSRRLAFASHLRLLSSRHAATHRVKRGLRLRLSVRLDSVRRSADAARRRAGPAHRSAPAISAPPMCCAPAAKALAAATLLGDMLKGTAAVAHRPCRPRPRCRDRCRARRVSRPPVSGLARLSRRQRRRDLYRPPARLRPVAGARRILRRLARGRGADAAIRRSPR